MRLRELENRVEQLEDGTIDAQAGDLATWIAAMEPTAEGGIVDESRRLYRYQNDLYQLPMAIVEMLEQPVDHSSDTKNTHQ